MANGVNMIPLKQVADHFGYETDIELLNKIN